MCGGSVPDRVATDTLGKKFDEDSARRTGGLNSFAMGDQADESKNHEDRATDDEERAASGSSPEPPVVPFLPTIRWPPERRIAIQPVRTDLLPALLAHHHKAGPEVGPSARRTSRLAPQAPRRGESRSE